MCIRDRLDHVGSALIARKAEYGRLLSREEGKTLAEGVAETCLLYTSDAADERSSVDLGGRRIIKKKKKEKERECGCKRQTETYNKKQDANSRTLQERKAQNI